jgi:hypothetical protein
VFGLNFYLDSGASYRYIGDGFAAQYIQNGGAVGRHEWHTAPSGTAGNAITFTQAMTLDANGDLAVGSTDADSRFKVEQTGVAGLRIAFNNTSQNFYDADLQVFRTGNGSERARIDSSGNLLLGTTSGSFNTRMLVAQTSSNVNVLALWNSATTGDNQLVQFFTDSGAGRGSITYNRTAGLTAYNTTSDYRAKDIIGPVTDSGALIDSTPVYMGKMKGATQERPMFIAHETPAYAHTGEKDAVDADGKPVYQQMDASALVPVMWAEIQSLRARVAALESN